MPLHDFRCPDCGRIEEVRLPITQRASQAEVYCAACPAYHTRNDYRPAMGTFNIRMEWVVPRTVGFDCSGGSTFQAFDVQQRQPDGSFKAVRVSSVRQMREIERTTEQRARDGEGEAMRFRMWSHNDSQGDVNSFGDDPSVQARKELGQLRQAALEAGGRKREARLEKVAGAEAAANAAQLGPGVTEDTTGAAMLEIG